MAKKPPKVRTTARPYAVSDSVKKAPRAKPNFSSAPKVGEAPRAPKLSQSRAVVSTKKPPVGNLNRATPPKTINMGHTPGSASRAVVPYKAPAKVSKLGALARGAGKVVGKVMKVAGPIGAAVGMISDATPAGAGSDKPSGALMKGNTYARVAPSRKYPTPPKQASAPSVATTVPKPKAKPLPAAPKSPTAAMAAPKPTPKPVFSKGPASGKMSYEPPKRGLGVITGTTTGTSATQKDRGGRVTGNGGLFGAAKRKLGK